jgi:formate dehydrogenase subunit delta
MSTHAHNASKPDNLIKMANQIGSFFETMPDRQQAQTDIAKHIKNFWALRMREALMKYVNQHEGAGLMDIVLEALRSRPEAIL